MKKVFTGPAPQYDETNGGRHTHLGHNFIAFGPTALAQAAKILDEGTRTHNDPDGSNWRRIPCEVHLNHALFHVNAWQRGVVGEDHLGHALVRLMMAVETEGGGRGSDGRGEGEGHVRTISFWTCNI